MAEETTGAARPPDSPADRPAPDSPVDRPQLRLRNQFLQDLSFESPQGATGLAGHKEKPGLKVDLNVASRPLEAPLHEVSLNISVRAAWDDDPCFLVEIDYRGVFSLTGADRALTSRALLIEAPRLLFPFARRIVADAVRDGGFPPLLMEPVDFAAFYRRNAAASAPAPEGGAG